MLVTLSLIFYPFLRVFHHSNHGGVVGLYVSRSFLKFRTSLVPFFVICLFYILIFIDLREGPTLWFIYLVGRLFRGYSPAYVAEPHCDCYMMWNYRCEGVFIGSAFLFYILWLCMSIFLWCDICVLLRNP